MDRWKHEIEETMRQLASKSQVKQSIEVRELQTHAQTLAARQDDRHNRTTTGQPFTAGTGREGMTVCLLTLLAGLGRHRSRGCRLQSLSSCIAGNFRHSGSKIHPTEPHKPFTRSRPGFHSFTSSRRSSPKEKLRISRSRHWARNPTDPFLVDNFPTLLFIPFPF